MFASSLVDGPANVAHFILFPVILVILGLVTLVGHGLWVLAALVFGAILGKERGTSKSSPRKEKCIQCGYWNPAGARYCESCGLAHDNPRAAELADLQATTRQLERLGGQGALDRAILEMLQAKIAVRRSQLTGRKSARLPEVPLPVPPTAPPEEEILTAIAAEPEPPVVPPPAPPWRAIEELLVLQPNVLDLSDPSRGRVLAWYQENHPKQVALLTPAAQGNLARLLADAGLFREAITVFQEVLTHHPRMPEADSLALEAGRLAARLNFRNETQFFLENFAGRSSDAAVRAEADQLLRDLTPVPPTPSVPAVRVVEEAPLDVLPVEAIQPTPPRPPPEPEPPPRPPRRSLGEMLAAFMEERNILWGELVGGLLIVGCSIALVISLWHTLEEHLPYFPFLLFAAITASLFGAGLYTLHHWKLESTSRGLLVIATLLVPLTSLVLAGLQRNGHGWLEAVINVAYVAGFVALMNPAARVLVPGGRWWLSAAVLGTSACQLLVAWLPGATPVLAWLVGLGCLAVACYTLGVASMIHLLFPARVTEPTVLPAPGRQGRSLLAFLGMTTFSLAVVLGFLLSRGGDLKLALEAMAVLVAVAGMPVLASGLVVHQRLAQDPV
ncbi:MAG: hypothetical protein JO112_09165, partial [Planctomycetes bacterium]|nr:hypothetical protein [Planctomycetota bacterium]